MSDHLPECINDNGIGCICDRLRACEARVLDTIRRDSWYEDGYAAALDAARHQFDYGLAYPLSRQGALAAIDALRATP